MKKCLPPGIKISSSNDGIHGGLLAMQILRHEAWWLGLLASLWRGIGVYSAPMCTKISETLCGLEGGWLWLETVRRWFVNLAMVSIQNSGNQNPHYFNRKIGSQDFPHCICYLSENFTLVCSVIWNEDYLRWARCIMLTISVLRRLRQEDGHGFKSSLCFTIRLCLKTIPHTIPWFLPHTPIKTFSSNQWAIHLCLGEIVLLCHGLSM